MSATILFEYPLLWVCFTFGFCLFVFYSRVGFALASDLGTQSSFETEFMIFFFTFGFFVLFCFFINSYYFLLDRIDGSNLGIQEDHSSRKFAYDLSSLDVTSQHSSGAHSAVSTRSSASKGKKGKKEKMDCKQNPAWWPFPPSWLYGVN